MAVDLGSEWMCNVQLSTAGGHLRVVHISVGYSQQVAEQPLFEFVVHNGEGQYDKAQNGGSSFSTQCCLIVIFSQIRRVCIRTAHCQ